MNYDSREDTKKHFSRVYELLYDFADKLKSRANLHDRSKMKTPEKELFDEFTPKLANSTYGSDEYKEMLKGLKPTLDHHYLYNSHHPEHYDNGIDGMNLLDLVEMFYDWKAASERHKNGDIIKSIEINKVRFNISDQLVSILNNTANQLKEEQK